MVSPDSVSGDPHIDEHLTPRQLANHAGVSDQKITNKIRSGKLRAEVVQAGAARRYRIPPEECNRFLNEERARRGNRGGGGTPDESAALRRDLEAEREAHTRTKAELASIRDQVVKFEEVARRLNHAIVQRSAQLVIEAQAAALDQFLVPDRLND